MPIFEYRCSACGHLEEVLQKHTDPAPETCPKCNAEKTLGKEISLAAFHLKGGGWYKDLYSSSSAAPDASGGASPPPAAGAAPTTPAAGTSDTKAAPAAPATASAPSTASTTTAPAKPSTASTPSTPSTSSSTKGGSGGSSPAAA